MKQCPLCGTSYVDPAVSFCLTDGSPLVAAADEQATVIRSGTVPMRVEIPRSVPSVSYAQQPQYGYAPPAVGGSGTVLKILLATALVLFLLLAVIGAAGALLYFNSGSREAASGPAAATPTPALLASITPAVNASPVINSPTPTAPATPSPTPPAAFDRDAALREVYDVENVIIRSTFRTDIAALESNTTDDFTSTDAQGRTFNKRQMIAEIRKGEARNYVYKLGKPTLVSADENTVVFRYQLQAGPPQSEFESVRLTETYVKRDGRWLLRSQRAGGR